MSEDLDLSDGTAEILETAERKPAARIRSEVRERYFISEGTGMEFWEVLGEQGYTSEELEEAKNELREKDLLHVRKVEDAAPYYSRFRGKLGSSMDMMFPRNRKTSGQAMLELTEEKERLEFQKDLENREEIPEKGRKLLEKAVEHHGEEKEEGLKELEEKGIHPDILRHEIQEEEYREGLRQLKEEDLAHEETRRYERRKCVWFRSEWVEEAPRTRFFFSPELFEKYFRTD